MDALLTDFRYAARALQKARGFTAVAVLTLALGLAATTTLFSVVYAVDIRRFPFVDQDRLVVGGENQTEPRSEVSYGNYQDWRASTKSFSDLAAMGSLNWSFVLHGRHDPALVPYRAVSGNFFQLLGAHAAIGRTLVAADDQPAAAPVVVLSDGFWQRQFGADSTVVGEAITLNDTAYTVVGVMPRDFQYPPGADLWTPLRREIAPLANDSNASRNVNVLFVVGRLRDGATLSAARAELTAVIRQLAARYHRPGHLEARLVWLSDDLLGSARLAVWMLFSAVLLLLLIMCANIGGLLLVRASGRGRETAIRLALGASAAAVARELLIESAILVGSAVLLALIASKWLLRAIVRTLPAEIPRLADAHVSGPVLAFVAIAAIATAVLCWLVPAWFVSRQDLEPALKASRHPTAASTWHLRSLASAEIALTVLLLVGAGLLLGTVNAVSRLDLGFNPRSLLALHVSLPTKALPTDPLGHAFNNRVVAELSRIQGVSSAAAVSRRPLQGPIGLDSGFRIEGQALGDATRNPFVNCETITDDYFRTMSMNVGAGRAFDSRDRATTLPVVVISDRLARVAWPNQNPIGKRLRVDALEYGRAPQWWTVVGTVDDVRYRGIDTPTYDVYAPVAQSPDAIADVVVRTVLPASVVVPAIRSVLRRVNPSGPMIIDAMDRVVEAAAAPWRANAALAAAFAAFALLLAVTSVYSVLAYAVTERTREFGVRSALGATPARLVCFVLLDGARLLVYGTAIGLVGAALSVQLMRSLLFGVSATDAATFTVAPLILAIVALGASLIPACRAARVDPVIALRAE